jgi:hypothetical protein
MRGDDVRTESAVRLPELRGAGAEGPSLRPIRTLVDQALTVLSPAFDQLYADIGRQSTPPEKLLRALLLQAL